MNYLNKKIDDCFSNSKTWQYAFEQPSESLLVHLEPDYDIRINRSYRRPFFVAENSQGVRIKGVLTRPIINVSFPDKEWESLKQTFELWLETL